jgi:hypothetical protein
MNAVTLTAREKARLKREREWLAAKVASARFLTDSDRVGILRALERAEQARRASRDPQQLAREEQVRRYLKDQGMARYRAVVERLESRSKPPAS